MHIDTKSSLKNFKRRRRHRMERHYNVDPMHTLTNESFIKLELWRLCYSMSWKNTLILNQSKELSSHHEAWPVALPCTFIAKGIIIQEGWGVHVVINIHKLAGRHTTRTARNPVSALPWLVLLFRSIHVGCKHVRSQMPHVKEIAKNIQTLLQTDLLQKFRPLQSRTSRISISRPVVV